MNYIDKYGNRKREPRKFQGGGDMPGAAAPAGPPEAAEGEAPAGPPPGAGAPPAGGGGEIESMLQEFVSTQDPQLAVQICTMMAAQMGIAAPAPAPAGGGAPTEMPGGAGMPGAPTGAGAGGMPMGKHGMSIPVRTQMRTFTKPTVIKPKL